MNKGDDVRSIDEQGLVEAAKGGDADAWEALYRDIYPRLVAFVRRRVAADAVDDVVDETMARAVAGIDRYRWESVGLAAWMFGIARHVCADLHRAEDRESRRVRASREIEADAPGEGLDLEAEHHAIRLAFETLGERDRELLELRIIAGLSVEETAEVLGKRVGAVRTAQSRALARLRSIVEQSP